MTSAARGGPQRSGITTGISAAAAIAAVSVLLVRRRRRPQSGPGIDPEPRSRWRAVTVIGGPEDVMPEGRLSDPLAALGSGIEVEVRAAPGDRGTELRARLRPSSSRGSSAQGARSSDDERVRRLRAALREAKQLIEVGEVLRVDPTPHGRRKRTPTGALVEMGTRRAPEEGTL